MVAGSLGSAWIDVHARTAGFGAELAGQLAAALKAAEKAGNGAFGRIATGAKLSAKAVAVSYGEGTRVAAAGFATMAEAARAADAAVTRSRTAAARAQVQAQADATRAVLTSLAAIQTQGTVVAERLAREFVGAGSTITESFEAAGRQVAAAIAFAARNGETSLIRLAERGQVAATHLSDSLRVAATGVQGSLRVAIDTVVADFARLAQVGDLSLSDVAVAGRLAAAALQESLGTAAQAAFVDFDVAATKISNALARATLEGRASFAQLSAAAAQAASEIVAAADREVAAQAKVAAGARSAAASFTAQASSIQKSFAPALESVASSLRNVTLGVAATGAAIGFFGFKAAADFERVDVALQGIFGEGAAPKLLKDLQEFANTTPFNFKNVSEFAVRLTALGKDADQVIPTLRTVGDAVAAVGGSSDNVDRVLLALTQLKAVGKVNFQDLNQIANALPSAFRGRIFDQFTKDLKKSNEGLALLKANSNDVREIISSDKGLAADFAVESLLNLFKKLPGATGALERQSLTLLGVLSNFGDKVRTTLITAFSPSLQPLARALNGITDEIGTALEPLAPRIADLFTSAVPEFGKLLVPLATSTISFFELLSVSIKPVLQGVIAVGNAFGSIFDAVQRFRAFLDGTSLGAAFVAGALGELRDVLVGLGPVLVNIGRAFRDAFVVLSPVLLPIVLLFTQTLKILEAIAGSRIGEALIAGAIAFGAVALAVNIYNAALIRTIASTSAATASSITLAGALGAVRTAMVGAAAAAGITSVATLGIAGAVGAATLAAGYFIGKGLASVFRDQADAAAVATAQVGSFQFNLSSLNAAVAQAQQNMGRLTAATLNFKDASGNLHLTVTDNLTGVAVRVVQLNNTLAAFRAANKDLLGPSIANNFEELSKARLRAAAEDARGKLIGPILPGTTRPNVTPKALNLGGLLNNSGGGSSGGGGGSSKALTEAEKTANKFAEDILGILDGIDKKFRNELVSGDRNSITGVLTALNDKIREAFKDAGKDAPSGLLKRIHDDNKKLGALATERDRLVERIKEANAKAIEVADSAKGFAALANLGLDTLGTAGGRTNTILPARVVAATSGAGIAEFKKSLDERLKKIRDFAADVQALSKKVAAGKFNKGLFDQIVSGGPEANGGVADVFANADQKTLDAVNRTQTAIDAASKGLGQTAADTLFDAGKQAGKGFLAGLQAQKDSIVKEMESIADALVKAIRQKLDMHSPSRVLTALGALSGSSFEMGIAGQIGSIQSTMARAVAAPNASAMNLSALANAKASQDLRFLIPSAALGASGPAQVSFQVDVQVNGVSDPMAARRAGIMAGEAFIQDLLADQRAMAALNGTG